MFFELGDRDKTIIKLSSIDGISLDLGNDSIIIYLKENEVTPCYSSEKEAEGAYETLLLKWLKFIAE